ncbi:hypothetical protein C5167_043475 [Papaver somniferum]|uniref:BED-type domain-containing protein n=1 Tax=Papaver somniferum TaxID=3469 RepID=A0A4Y7L6T8_PAPSO|nr:hypothetical protein C5167_043475 [Papaver somniferum]
MEDSQSTPASVNSNALFPPLHPLPRSSNASTEVSSVGKVPTTGEAPSAPASNVSDAGTVTAPASKKRKKTSWVWDHVDLDPPPSIMVTCKKCKQRMKADSSTHGTDSLNNHLRKCLNLIPKDSGQSTLSFEPARLGEDEKLVAVTFCQDSCRKALIIFIIVDEQPFRIVEGEGFREFCRVLESIFKIPSRITVRRDVMELFAYEKERLKNYFKVNKVRVCLTTDTWSSLQKLGYMVITAHWIDANWKLHKKIISFIQIEYDISIKRIRAIVKYCMGSPARLKKFMDCVAYEKIECKKGLVLDVDTRWNSTFIMLDSAEKYQPSFERLEYEDKAFKKKFCFVESQVPLVSSTCSTFTVDNQPDWDVDENQVAELSSDEEVIATTKRGKKRKRTSSFSASTHVTAHEFLFHVSVIHRTLNTWENHKDTFVYNMGLKMQSKYNEYWGRYEKMNNLMFIVVLLNPQDKELGLKFLLGQLGIGGGYLRTKLMDLVMRDFKALFEEYWDVQMSAGNSTVVTDSSGGNTVGAEPDDEGDCAAAALMAERAREEEESFDGEGKNELETYLREKREPRKEKVSFDILGWWKTNSTRYPTLTLMERDILVRPISSMASESAFSTGRRILDPYRSSLLPTTVEALICAQNWLKTPIDLDISSLGPEEEVSSVSHPGKLKLSVDFVDAWKCRCCLVTMETVDA